MVVVDAMHNLFLGLVQFHIRKVLGISTEEAQADEGCPVTKKEINKTKRLGCSQYEGTLSGANSCFEKVVHGEWDQSEAWEKVEEKKLDSAAHRKFWCLVSTSCH